MIKRLLWLVVTLVCVVRSASAQQGLQGYVVTGTGAQARIVLTGSAIVFHQLTWNVTGTVSSCTVALDTSADGVSWSAGNAIAGQTCTSNGQSALSSSAVFNFVRVNTTAFSGTGSVVITWAGYVATPGGLPSGCTSPGTGAITCTGTVLGANLPLAFPTTPNSRPQFCTETPSGGIAPTGCTWGLAGASVTDRGAGEGTYTFGVTDIGNYTRETNGAGETFTIPDGNTGGFTIPVNIGIIVQGFASTLQRQTASQIRCTPNGALANSCALTVGIQYIVTETSDFNYTLTKSGDGAAAGALVQVPATTATNTVAPTASGVVGLTVQASTTAPGDALDVCASANCTGANKYLSVDPNGFTIAKGTIYAQGQSASISLVLDHGLNFDNTGNSTSLDGVATAGRNMLFTDASGTLETGLCVNVTPVTTTGGAVTTDQNMQACTINAKALNLAGRAIRIHSSGTYTTAAASSSAMSLEVKLCAVSTCSSGTQVDLCDITTSTLGALSISNNTWVIDCIAATQTAGASSVYERSGELKIDLALSNTAADTVFLDSNATAVTAPVIDNTAQMFLQIAGAFTVANAANVFTGRLLTVEIIN